MTVHSTRCPAAEQRADRRRPAAPGQDNRKFVDGFRGLKQIGCQDFCSPDQPRAAGASPGDHPRTATGDKRASRHCLLHLPKCERTQRTQGAPSRVS
ncbi:MAG: hypothetical protein GW892_08790 [Armatimonadetes bacterium]|nr:hypothetical protein [Armatimonadota bacterium]NCQ30352.1 hypothetical protein [Armatimonadota bacterium]